MGLRSCAACKDGNLLALVVLGIVQASAFTGGPSDFNVGWSTPSAQPGRTIGGLDTYQDGMPLGNGRVTVGGGGVSFGM